MKKEYIALVVIAGLVALYLLYPEFLKGFAKLRTNIGDKKTTITGTASKGDDSGGVLTNTMKRGANNVLRMRTR